eukprot:2876372-Pleurochrysis_carterae.AAC.1
MARAALQPFTCLHQRCRQHLCCAFALARRSNATQRQAAAAPCARPLAARGTPRARAGAAACPGGCGAPAAGSACAQPPAPSGAKDTAFGRPAVYARGRGR